MEENSPNQLQLRVHTNIGGSDLWESMSLSEHLIVVYRFARLDFGRSFSVKFETNPWTLSIYHFDLSIPKYFCLAPQIIKKCIEEVIRIVWNCFWNV